MELLPYQELFLWSVGIALIVSILYRLLTKPGELRKVKEDSKYYQEKMKKAQKEGDMKKQQEFMNEMMKQSSKQFRLMMKPLLLSFMIYIVIVFWYLAGIYGIEGSEVVVNLPFWLPFFGTAVNWLWWYIIASMPFTMIFRKLLGVD